MPSSSLTCLSCDRPFPRNGELASLPEGRRIAFDLGQRRVWRICTKCGEWNLLGAKAAVAALVELEARVGVLTPEVMTSVGALEVLRLDAAWQPTSALRARGDRQARVATRNMRMAGILVGMLLLGIGTLAYMALDPITPGGGSRWGQIWPMILAAMSGPLLSAIPRLRRLGHSGRTNLGLGLLLFAGALWAAQSTGGSVGQFATLAGALVLTQVMVQMVMPVGRTTLSPGRRRWVTMQTLDSASCSWDDAGCLTLRLPSGELLEGEDATVMLRDLLDGWSWETGPDELEAAALLASGHDALPRIISVLREAGASSTEGTMLGRVPATWRAALDLALTQETGVEGKLSRILAKAPEAQQVAEIAESLDRGDA